MSRKSLFTAVIILSGLMMISMARKDDMATVSYFKDTETFIIIAKGKPVAGETDMEKRMYQAKRAAVSVAMFEMSIKLQGFEILDQIITRTKFDRKQTCALTYTVKVRKKKA